ncbi:hypothetical protein M422DRAFT_49499 [Sphaerobolus stellatus SS14]|uniref:Uncharacterized protein n=1 Tax=Sphaerobolus stellatus (strain SS14) TaxID=990650 RepID=A0A0C9UY24_SPHS4|nr:hypothetical protein M422DRAFT_49499 [Sphaerobolus stellatus SS14]
MNVSLNGSDGYHNLEQQSPEDDQRLVKLNQQQENYDDLSKDFEEIKQKSGNLEERFNKLFFQAQRYEESLSFQLDQMRKERMDDDNKLRHKLDDVKRIFAGYSAPDHRIQITEAMDTMKRELLQSFKKQLAEYIPPIVDRLIQSETAILTELFHAHREWMDNQSGLSQRHDDLVNSLNGLKAVVENWTEQASETNIFFNSGNLAHELVQYENKSENNEKRVSSAYLDDQGNTPQEIGKVDCRSTPQAYETNAFFNNGNLAYEVGQSENERETAHQEIGDVDCCPAPQAHEDNISIIESIREYYSMPSGSSSAMTLTDEFAESEALFSCDSEMQVSSGAASNYKAKCSDFQLMIRYILVLAVVVLIVSSISSRGYQSNDYLYCQRIRDADINALALKL